MNRYLEKWDASRGDLMEQIIESIKEDIHSGLLTPKDIDEMVDQLRVLCAEKYPHG